MAGVSLRPRLGAEGWEAWLRLGRRWESLIGVDVGEGLKGYTLAEIKYRKEVGMNGEEGVDSQVD